MAKAQEKLEWIEARIAEGRTVTVSTHTRATPWKPKTVASFKTSGIAPFKTEGDALVMYTGSTRGRARYDCIDYCRITAA